MPELPEIVPRAPFFAACGLALVGFIAIVFAGGSAPIIWIGALLVLAGAAIGGKIGLDLWKATE